MTRNEMIEQILEYNIELCQDNSVFNDEFIHDLLSYGHKGLENMTLDELEAEAKQCEFYSLRAYQLDEMQSDTEPMIQICFEEDEWDGVDAKREVLDYLATDLKRLGIDDGGATADALEQLATTGKFNEVSYFDCIERLFNEAQYYTYNSDTWLEVYTTTDEGDE